MKLNCGHIHSLISKLDDLHELITTLDNQGVSIEFILLCETFINSRNEKLCSLPGYELVCKNREGRGGGVAIFIKKGIAYNLREDIMVNVQNEFESIFIEVTTECKSKKVLVGEVYRVPNTNPKYSLQRFKTIIDKINNSTDQVIIGTDQNFDFLKIDQNVQCDKLLCELLGAGLLPTISKPTRITHTSSTLIDNIYIKGCNTYNSKSAILYTDISDHFPILTFIGKKSHKYKEPLVFYHRPLTQDKVNNINHDLKNTDWSVLHENELDDAYDYFIDKFNICIDRHAPLTRVTIPQCQIKREPWITKGLLKSIHKKHILFKKCHKMSRNDETFKEYKAYCKVLNKLKRNAKKSYYTEIFNQYRNDIKKTWRLINTLSGKLKDKSSTVQNLVINGKNLSSSHDIANGFAKYFAEIGKNQASKIAQGNSTTQRDKQNINFHHTLFIHPTDRIEVSRIITDLKPKKSQGYDNINTILVKKT